MRISFSKRFLPLAPFHPRAIGGISRYLLFVVLLFVLLTLIACGGGQKKTNPVPAPTPDPGAIQAIVVPSELVVGPSRFVIGLAHQGEKSLIIDAQLHFRIFKLEDGRRTQTLKAEMDARSVTIRTNFTHVHKDGILETHEAGTVGVYVAMVDFDSPGEWGVVITGTHNGVPLPALSPAFEVRAESRTIAVGAAAPRTVQTILKDVAGDISKIDTSNPPDPHLHNITIADAVGSGRPTLIVFSTPGFCQTKICGPVKDVVDQLYEKYQGQANFIHVEPYDLERLRSGQGLSTVPAMVEWGLPSEPWVFMVNRAGKVAAKFEGVVSFDELEQAFTPLLRS